MDYDWPGNIRELEHTMEHAFILCNHTTITVDHLPPELKNLEFNEETTITKKEVTESAQSILEALEKTAWNKAKAARLLGISRRTLYRKMEEYKILNNKTE